MEFLKSFFSGKAQTAEDKAFTDFFNDSFARYFSLADPDFRAELDNKFDDPMLPQEYFPSAYEECLKANEVWEKRSILFAALDQHYLLMLTKWQAMERFLIDRFPEKALAYVKEFGNEQDFEDADFLASFARCLCVLSRYQEALKYARKAVSLDAGSNRAQLALADLLHLTGERGKAHEVFKKAVASSSLARSGTTGYGLYDLVCFKNNIVHSSVYAVGLLKSSEAPESEWARVEPEFYFCPYFRSQHAFYLIQNKQSLKGMSKLITLAKEFPTYKEGVVNAYSVIKQYQRQMGKADLMKSDEEFLLKVLDKNGWNGKL